MEANIQAPAHAEHRSNSAQEHRSHPVLENQTYLRLVQVRQTFLQLVQELEHQTNYHLLEHQKRGQGWEHQRVQGLVLVNQMCWLQRKKELKGKGGALSVMTESYH